MFYNNIDNKDIMLKKSYKSFWVPIMGRLVTRLIPLLEGRSPNKLPTYDIDGDKKIKKNKRLFR